MGEPHGWAEVYGGAFPRGSPALYQGGEREHAQREDFLPDDPHLARAEAARDVGQAAAGKVYLRPFAHVCDPEGEKETLVRVHHLPLWHRWWSLHDCGAPEPQYRRRPFEDRQGSEQSCIKEFGPWC